MNLADITPLILTYNEAANIRATLTRLQWAEQIVVVDSFSDDATLEILAAFPNVRTVQRKFENHTQQWNFGLEQIETRWVLALDADYQCTAELISELKRLEPIHNVYSIKVDYAIFGAKLRTSLYPPRLSLFLVRDFQYQQDGHTQLLKVDASETVGHLKHALIHDDRKSLDHWIHSQLKYANLEAQKLISRPKNELGWKDRIRRWYVLAPFLTLFYCLFFKLLILDGWPGIFYSFQRTFAELLLSLKLLDQKFRNKNSSTPDAS